MSTQSENTSDREIEKRRAVILLNFGGPKSLTDVKPFLKRIFSDSRVMGLTGRIAAWMFSKSIIHKSIQKYEKIGESSPLVEISSRQASALQDELVRRGEPMRVYIGMRYSPPEIEDSLLQAIFDGAGDFLIVPLYPHYSITTTGSVFAYFAQIIKKVLPGAKGSFVSSYEDHPGYIKALASKLKEKVETALSYGEDPHVLFSAHSLPGRLIKKDKLYINQIKQTAEFVARAAGIMRYGLAYQSGRKGWLGPSVENTLQSLARTGCESVIISPLSFTCDNIETLYDIDIMLKEEADNLGIVLRRTESLNDSPEFINALADIVLMALQDKKTE